MHIVTYVLALAIGLVMGGINMVMSQSLEWVAVSAATFFFLALLILGVIELHGRALIVFFDNLFRGKLGSVIYIAIIVAIVDFLGLAGVYFGAELAKQAGLTVRPAAENANDIKPLLLICAMALPMAIVLDLGTRAIRRREIHRGAKHGERPAGKKTLKSDFEKLLQTANKRTPEQFIEVSSGLSLAWNLFHDMFGTPARFATAGRKAQSDFIAALARLEDSSRNSGQINAGLGMALFRKYAATVSESHTHLANEMRTKLKPFVDKRAEEKSPQPPSPIELVRPVPPIAPAPAAPLSPPATPTADPAVTAPASPPAVQTAAEPISPPAVQTAAAPSIEGTDEQGPAATTEEPKSKEVS